MRAEAKTTKTITTLTFTEDEFDALQNEILALHRANDRVAWADTPICDKLTDFGTDDLADRGPLDFGTIGVSD